MCSTSTNPEYSISFILQSISEPAETGELKVTYGMIPLHCGTDKGLQAHQVPTGPSTTHTRSQLGSAVESPEAAADRQALWTSTESANLHLRRQKMADCLDKQL